MNTRKSRRDDDNKSGGRPRIPSKKSSESFSTRDKDSNPKKLLSGNFGDAPKRSYNKRSEGSNDKPFVRKPYGDRDNSEKRPYTKREGGNDKPFVRKPYGDRDNSEKRPYTKREGGNDKPFVRKPYGDRDNEDKRSFAKRSEGGNDKPFVRKPYGDGDNTEKRSYTKRDGGNDKTFVRKPYGDRDNTEKRSYTKRDGGNDKPFVRKPYGDRDNTEKRPYTKRSESGNDQPFVRKSFGDRDNTEKRPYTKREEGNDKPFVRKPYGDRDNTEKRTYTKRSEGGGDQPFVRKPYGDRDNTEKRSYTKRDGSNDQPFVRKPYGDRDNTEKRPYTKRSEGGNDQPFVRKSFGDRDNSEKRSYTKRGEGDFNRNSEFNPERRSSDGFSKPYKKSFGSRDDGFRKTFTSKKKDSETDNDPDYIRLNRYLSNAGICSRREADELIESGVVTVNGELVTELGTKVHREKDVVRYNNEPVRREPLQYIVMNKPKDFITTTDDPQDRKTVSSLVEKLTSARLYPVGRLDRNTTGVLLLTNDGDLTLKLTHPKFGITKVYAVELDKKLRQEDFTKIKSGLTLEDGPIQVDDIAYIEDMDKNHIGVQLHSGRNRIVRRIFESLDYKVLKLDRTSFATLSKKGLKRGECRFLTPAEVGRLKNLKS